MLNPVSLLVFLYISKISADNISCTTAEGKQGTCVFIDYCPSILKTFVNSTVTLDLICNKTIDTVCCTAPRSSSSYGTELSDRRYCGFQHTDDYGHDGFIAAIDEFPWLAVIVGIYFDTEKRVEELRCHGVLINNRYLLSSAHCFGGPGDEIYNATDVLLGEYYRNTSRDCIDLPQFETTECNEAERFQIDETIIHPLFSYKHSYFKSDIALIRLNKVVTYSDYIRPICLPIDGTVFSKVGDVLYTAGWGHLTYGGKGAVVKKKIPTVLVTNKECQNAYKDVVVPEIIYICTTEFLNNTEHVCQGDAGVPAMFKHKNQWHVEGISAKTIGCGLENPGAYVRVTSYLEWIKQNIRP